MTSQVVVISKTLFESEKNPNPPQLINNIEGMELTNTQWTMSETLILSPKREPGGRGHLVRGHRNVPNDILRLRWTCAACNEVRIFGSLRQTQRSRPDFKSRRGTGENRGLICYN